MATTLASSPISRHPSTMDPDTSALPGSVERSYPLDCLSDTHDFHQLLVGLDGRVDVEIEGRGAAVAPGSVCLIPAAATHHYLGLGAGNRCRVLDLPVGEPHLEALFERIRFLRLAPEEGRELDDDALLSRLTGAPPLTGPRLNMARLTRRVQADPAAPWNLARLAEASRLSERQLRRSLGALTGLTPWQWLQRQRLARAARLLDTSEATITEIALACGFADGAQFSRHFRGWRGMTPSAFRRRPH
ncbi:helix-turn-helix transcriptional regulator [Halomonas stenophila]|uniref:AraC-like DNA-binding protein n=1 Tax=Halomonas stenophila TaxID=795312 RepID=A0A7W5EWT3_9GAMM|nr:AraC family transcriptional regulator [Halomonas stenophila]MBB3232126.1 AraC-like DNA-binding protein [Halomonas stenophila]